MDRPLVSLVRKIVSGVKWLLLKRRSTLTLLIADSHDSEAYLSDAQGRQVTPRITVDPARIEALSMMPQAPIASGRGRGRPPKRTVEQEAHDAYGRLVSLKRRIGGPGMDRGGVTLANDKRRRGFIETDEMEEELVDVED